MWQLPKKVWTRLERLALTFIAKKYVAWIVSIWLLLRGNINSADWCLFTAAIFVIDAYSKAKTPVPAAEPQGDC